jgi:hypothetical protein
MVREEEEATHLFQRQLRLFRDARSMLRSNVSYIRLRHVVYEGEHDASVERTDQHMEERRGKRKEKR